MSTLDFYRNKLRVNRHRLDEELEEHAQRLEEIGRKCAELNRAVDKARAQRDITAARHANRVRAADPKATVDSVKAQMMLDPGCVGANELLRDAELEHAEWEALNRAWYQRGFDLKALAELFGAQYFAINSVTIERGQTLREGDIAVRRALREASAQVNASVATFTRLGEREEASVSGIRRRAP